MDKYKDFLVETSKNLHINGEEKKRKEKKKLKVKGGDRCFETFSIAFEKA